MNHATFSHDGIHDTLTNLAAPPYFYQELKREVSRYERSGASFTLVGITFDKKPTDIGYDVLVISTILRDLLRADDLAARVGDYEFTLLVRSGEAGAKKLVNRIKREWIANRSERVRNSTHQDSGNVQVLVGGRDSEIETKLEIKLSEYVPGNSALEALNQLDRHQPSH